MILFPENLHKKLEVQKQNNAFRQLSKPNDLVDFSSNDYLGIAKNQTIFDQTQQILIERNIKKNGSTGSRLLSGNHEIFEQTEKTIAHFHDAQTALIFNSGYDANLGFFSSVPQKNDIILYDQLCHASIRDGIRLSTAKSIKFKHNDFEDLEKLLVSTKTLNTTNFFIVTESVFSMDGDSPNLQELAAISQKNNCFLIVDEAHAVGVFGENGQGMVHYLQLQNLVFARIITFGKAFGCHGSAVLGSQKLKDYLINFARSFIYTTALSPHAIATILVVYKHEKKLEIQKLRENIVFFNQQKNLLGLKPLFIYSKSAIQSAIIPGNEAVKKLATTLQKKGYDAKPILSPTVALGQERLRICLHSFNSKQEIIALLEEIKQQIF